MASRQQQRTRGPLSKTKTHVVALAFSMALIVPVSAPAQAKQEPSTMGILAPLLVKASGAQKLRTVQIFFMVQALQCRLRGNDKMAAAYNQFMRSNRDAMQQNAQALNVHFAARGGTRAQDSWLTSLANTFAADAARDPKDCNALASAAHNFSNDDLND